MIGNASSLFAGSGANERFSMSRIYRPFFWCTVQSQLLTAVFLDPNGPGLNCRSMRWYNPLKQRTPWS